jgi:ABC-type branched-subunit amino acid transport system ATPase component
MVQPQVSAAEGNGQSPPAISARGIRVSGPWGPVYGPVDLDVPDGGLTVLICPPGTGRTALLLTLAGRMKPADGTLEVFGLTRARDVFAVAAVAGIDELDTVPESVTVGDLVTERLRWNASWYKLIRRADDDDLRRVCGPVFGDRPLPPLRRFAEELDELDAVLLRIALAHIASPRLLVVGSIDAVASDVDRAVLLERLVDLGTRHTVVTTSANPLPAGVDATAIPVANTVVDAPVGDEKGAQ